MLGKSKILVLSLCISALYGCGDNDSSEHTASKPSDEFPAFKPTLLDYTPGNLLKTGSSDASTAVSIDPEYIIVADDEINALRVYPKNGGDAVAEWSFQDNGPLLKKELDIEASALLKNNTAFFIGSHGNKKDGGDAPDRSHLFAVELSGKGANTQFKYVGVYSNLENDLVEWDKNNSHQQGANYFGFETAAAKGVAPENTHGFAIEGLTASHDENVLFMGFRAPQLDQKTRDKALIIPLNNYQALVKGTAAKASFGSAIELNLGGRGIRSLAKTLNNQYLIVAGPAIGNRAEIDKAFALYLWDGKSSTPQLLNKNLEALRTDSKGSIESIVETNQYSEDIQVLLDNGDSIWPNQSQVSKDLEPHLQKFQGATFHMGTAISDLTPPKIVSVSPKNGTLGVNRDTTIEVRFNEGIALKSGNILIYENDQLIDRIPSDAQNIRKDFNRLKIKPNNKFKESTAYKISFEGFISDHSGNTLPAQQITAFTTAQKPTALAVGDIRFMAGNAEAPDAIAFILLKDVDGGTEIYFSDRDYSDEKKTFWNRSKNTVALNEGVFRWTADQQIKAGSIITIQTDTPASPIANIGQVFGSPSGIGKEETIYAMIGTQVKDLEDGVAGEVLSVGQFLAALTLGGNSDNDIPLEIKDYYLAFMPTKAEQTNAIYDVEKCGLERSNLQTLSKSIANANCWRVSYKSQGAVGYPLLEQASLFKNAIVK